MLKNRKFIIVILCSILIVCLLPLTIDWLIIGNNVPSNISNSDWVGFLGGYIGAIIGAIVSLVGIVITIRYTSKENKTDRELQVRPYCSIRSVYDNKIVGTNKRLGEYILTCEPMENNGPEYTEILYVKNVGLGPAIDLEVFFDYTDDGREHVPSIVKHSKNSLNNSVYVLQSGEEGAYVIRIYFNFDPINEEDIIEGAFGKTFKSEVHNKYKNFDVIVTIKYCDLYQNIFSQKVIYSSNFSIINDDGVYRHSCGLTLNDITPPRKTSIEEIKEVYKKSLEKQTIHVKLKKLTNNKAGD